MSELLMSAGAGIGAVGGGAQPTANYFRMIADILTDR